MRNKTGILSESLPFDSVFCDTCGDSGHIPIRNFDANIRAEICPNCPICASETCENSSLLRANRGNVVRRLGALYCCDHCSRSECPIWWVVSDLSGNRYASNRLRKSYELARVNIGQCYRFWRVRAATADEAVYLWEPEDSEYFNPCDVVGEFK